MDLFFFYEPSFYSFRVSFPAGGGRWCGASTATIYGVAGIPPVYLEHHWNTELVLSALGVRFLFFCDFYFLRRIGCSRRQQVDLGLWITRSVFSFCFSFLFDSFLFDLIYSVSGSLFFCSFGCLLAFSKNKNFENEAPFWRSLRPFRVGFPPP